MISNFHDFARKIRQILQNSKNWRNNIFMFIDVSPKIFELQRRTIPHFKAWNKLIWPFVIHFSAKSDISWSAEQNTCPILFAPDFRYSVLWKKYTINLSSPICLLPLICMFISYVHYWPKWNTTLRFPFSDFQLKSFVDPKPVELWESAIHQKFCLCLDNTLGVKSTGL